MFFLVFLGILLSILRSLFLLYFSMGRTIAGCFIVWGETNEVSVLFIGLWDVY